MSRPEYAKAFEVAQIRCQNYPNCLEVLSLAKIEEHEKIECKFRVCKQCNRCLKQDIISMQAHLELHCGKTNLICQFCKVTLTRDELRRHHQCAAVYPIQKFMINSEMVVNASIVPRQFASLVTCFFCKNYLRMPQ